MLQMAGAVGALKVIRLVDKVGSFGYLRYSLGHSVVQLLRTAGLYSKGMEYHTSLWTLFTESTQN